MEEGGQRKYIKQWVDTSGQPHDTDITLTDEHLSHKDVHAVKLWVEKAEPESELFNRGQEDDEEDEHKEPAFWIMGPATHAFPNPTGWTPKRGNVPFSGQQIRSLPDLTIHNITTHLTYFNVSKDTRPNCETNWTKRLNINISVSEWTKVWASLGTPLSDPTEEKTLASPAAPSNQCTQQTPQTHHATEEMSTRVRL